MWGGYKTVVFNFSNVIIFSVQGEVIRAIKCCNLSRDNVALQVAALLLGVFGTTFARQIF